MQEHDSEEWKNVLAAHELRAGDVRELSHRGNDVLLFRTRSGALRAMEAYCPHQRNYIPNGLPSGQGLDRLLEDEELICPFHQWRFDGLGLCTGLPAGQRVPVRIKNGERVGRSWPVRESNGVIQIGVEHTTIDGGPGSDQSPAPSDHEDR